LLFLPPYSPDYNPIEQALKAWLRRRNQEQLGLSAIGEACRRITPEMAAGWYRASGYM
ncbi:hypothetical protein FA95DRAFT_1501394, partial [Auriscalpium vulgare]